MSVTPPASATGFDTNAPILVKFNKAMNASTILSGTVMLQNSSGDNVPATVSYNSNNDTATLTPDAALNTSATYTVVVDGGAEGVVGFGRQHDGRRLHIDLHDRRSARHWSLQPCGPPRPRPIGPITPIRGASNWA